MKRLTKLAAVFVALMMAVIFASCDIEDWLEEDKESSSNSSSSGSNTGGTSSGSTSSGTSGEYREYYKVGDVVLNDGTAISVENVSSMTKEQKTKAIAVIFYVGTASDVLGAKTLGVGLYNTQGESTKELAWARWTSTDDYAKGLKTNITAIQCEPSAMIEAATTATFTGDTDGSDNWKALCAAVDDEGKSGNYPAWEWVNSYATRYSLTGEYTSGWYMPTIAELAMLYRQKSTVNTVLKASGGTNLVADENTLYWSSSQVSQEYWPSGDSAWDIAFIDGSLLYTGKPTKQAVCCIRAFNNKSSSTSDTGSETPGGSKSSSDESNETNSGSSGTGENGNSSSQGNDTITQSSSNPFSGYTYVMTSFIIDGYEYLTALEEEWGGSHIMQFISDTEFIEMYGTSGEKYSGAYQLMPTFSVLVLNFLIDSSIESRTCRYTDNGKVFTYTDVYVDEEDATRTYNRSMTFTRQNTNNESNESSATSYNLTEHQILIKDGDNGNPLSNAEITVRNSYGTNIATTKTDSSGKATLPNSVFLTDGTYSMTINCDGYISTTDTLTILDGKISVGSQISISKASTENCIKIILDWGATPRDLDAHLVMGNEHLCYSNKAVDNGNIILDIDDTTSYGPETVTIKNINSEATYKYYVHNFSRENPTMGLSASNARVRLYINNQYIATYTVPSGQSGTYWHVFNITNGGTVNVKNNISTTAP